MVGGKIIDIRHLGDKVRLWCVSTYDASGDAKTGIFDECGVYIDVNGEIPSLGDDVWWQSGSVYWTPSDRRFQDHLLRKIGYSSSSPEMLTCTVHPDDLP